MCVGFEQVILIFNNINYSQYTQNPKLQHPNQKQMLKFTKSHKNKLKNLTNLTYQNLLSQLITHHKKYPQFNYRDSVDYLKLSTIHQSDNLLFLSMYMNNVLKKTGFKLNDYVNNTTMLWYEISIRGMATIHQNAYLNKFLYRLSPYQYQTQRIKTINYFKDITSILQKPTIQKNSSQKFLEILSYGLPSTYDISSYSFDQYQMFKQHYINMLEKFFRLGGENIVSWMTDQSNFGNLFPVQLFNSTDQALISDLYLKYISPNLTNLSQNSNQAFQLISRFNLPCYSFILKSLKTLNQQTNILASTSTQTQTQTQTQPQTRKQIKSLNIYNKLFLIYRKMGIQSQHNKNLFRIQIKQLIYTIMTKFKLSRILDNVSNIDDKIERLSFLKNFVQEWEESAVKEVMSQEGKIVDLENQLCQCFGIQGVNIGHGENKYNLVKFLIRNKILRSILLTAHIYKQKQFNKINQKQIQNLSILLHSCKDIIKKSITFGDLLPELIYLDDRFIQLHNQSLFSNQIKDIVENAKNQYKSVLKKIQKKQGIYNMQDKLGNPQYFYNRINCAQYLLLSNSRLIYSNSIPEEMIPDYSQLTQKNIMLSLINDKQFISTFPAGHIKSATFNLLQENLGIKCLKQKKSQNYPYFPEFSVKHLQSPVFYFYFQDNLCHQTRIKSSKNYIIDVTNEKDLGKIKKMKLHPQKYLSE